MATRPALMAPTSARRCRAATAGRSSPHGRCTASPASATARSTSSTPRPPSGARPAPANCLLRPATKCLHRQCWSWMFARPVLHKSQSACMALHGLEMLSIPAFVHSLPLACAVNLTIHRCRERQTLLAAIPGKRVRSCACTILKLAREPCRSWNRNQDAISTTADQVYIVRPNATTCPNKAQGGANLAFVASAPSLTPRTGARRLQSVF